MTDDLLLFTGNTVKPAQSFEWSADGRGMTAYCKATLRDEFPLVL
jgi:hypothetical protein